MRISKAQALQRTGRAGRESSGTCYRIYTEEEFDSLKKNTVPEILRYLTIKKKGKYILEIWDCFYALTS